MSFRDRPDGRPGREPRPPTRPAAARQGTAAPTLPRLSHLPRLRPPSQQPSQAGSSSSQPSSLSPSSSPPSSPSQPASRPTVPPPSLQSKGSDQPMRVISGSDLFPDLSRPMPDLGGIGRNPFSDSTARLSPSSYLDPGASETGSTTSFSIVTHRTGSAVGGVPIGLFPDLGRRTGGGVVDSGASVETGESSVESEDQPSGSTSPISQTSLNAREEDDRDGRPTGSQTVSATRPRSSVFLQQVLDRPVSGPIVRPPDDATTSIERPRRTGWHRRLYTAFRRAYWPDEEPAIVYPSPPTDAEKKLYEHTNRVPLYVFGIFSFLSLSVGMWLFVVSSPIFAWFGVISVMVQFYLIISYVVGVIGKDYDAAGHCKIKADNPITAENAPTVDIYLPCCREPVEILENTYRYVSQLDWYADKLSVHVMDDGGMPEVAALAAKYGFNYSVRPDRPHMRKAGNLRHHFQVTDGEYIVIFDADFCPRADYLRELAPELMADPNLALVQTPQYFRVLPEQTWTEQGAGAVQELFYRVVQVNRNRWGASICVGSNALYRRTALAEDGGTANINYSEDVHTGFGCVSRNWRLLYLPIILATGVCPDSPRAFFNQQMRWARGSTSLLSNRQFWKSPLRPIQKICYLCGFLYYSAVSLSIFVSPLPGILLLWIRPEFFKYYNLAFAIPSLIYGLVFYRAWAKARYGFNVQHIMVIQSYAYLIAIKDHFMDVEFDWVPTGNSKAHKLVTDEKSPSSDPNPDIIDRSGTAVNDSQMVDLEWAPAVISEKPGSSSVVVPSAILETVAPVVKSTKKKKKNNKYRNMRILCWIWTIITLTLVFTAVGYRVGNGFPWYHTIPIILLNLYTLYLTHPFLVYVG